ncbi:MAG: hypothetical protein JWP74_3834 [Marmoricola sp.]|nr:hypothetical protein [Marmoricola sp.]
MSLLNPANAYRRSNNRPRIPVVLPMVRVIVDDTGRLDVELDDQPFETSASQPGSEFTRAELPDLLDQIARERNSAIRIEIHEPDGKVFTDFHTAVPFPVDAPEPTGAGPRRRSGRPRKQRPALTARMGAGEITGAGFTAGEEVAVAVVMLRQWAADDGSVAIHLPVALLERHHADVVLIGDTSGTVSASTEQESLPAREAS